MKVKRYLLFYGEAYYPIGGWNDYKGSFDTIEEAKALMEKSEWKPDWYDIVDTETSEKVE